MGGPKKAKTATKLTNLAAARADKKLATLRALEDSPKKRRKPRIRVTALPSLPTRKGKPRLLPFTKPQGRRLWSMKAVEIAIRTVVDHGRACNGANFHIVREHRTGMVSQLTLKCEACRYTVPVKTDSDDCTLSCTEAAVWAGNTTGSGYTVMRHAFAALDVPFVTWKTYLQKEQKFHHEMKAVRDEVLLENGREERENYSNCRVISFIC